VRGEIIEDRGERKEERRKMTLGRLETRQKRKESGRGLQSEYLSWKV
jgi:hypothetical protein